MSSFATLDKRLESVAELVRVGAVLADVGTDHGYLPIFLLKTGRIERAVLSDVNEGPLSSARANIRAEGLCERVQFVLADGAEALSCMGVTDYVIAGMGGELIADIVERALHLRDGDLRLILQPMTKQAFLRQRLYSLGFAVVHERYSYAEGKYYLTLVCEYRGTPCEISDIYSELGDFDACNGDIEARIGYLVGKEHAYQRARDGKVRGRLDCAYEDRMLEAIKESIEKLKRYL